MEIDLSGRTAIVTGAGRGIGQVIAESFAESGANVVAAARTQSEIDDTVAACEERGVEGLAVQTDLAAIDDIDDLIDTTVEEFGTPEILINNAAANIAGPPLDHTVDEIDTMLDVNLRGLYVLSQRFGQAFRDDPADMGRIVNVASIAGQLGVPVMTVYGGTKAALYGMTRGLAAELAQDGVTVNTVTPGLILVERIENVIDEMGDQLFDLDRIPAGRIGEPEDIADACRFLASEQAEYITGQDLTVDGGVTFTAGLYK